MAIRLSKPWRDFTEAEVRTVQGQLGVFELADAAGTVLYIGHAGARTLFGLRSALQEALAAHGGRAVKFRIEVNMQYRTRWQELLMVHKADHGGRLPPLNEGEPLPSLGRLSPA